jgi:hypothetical protein
MLIGGYNASADQLAVPILEMRGHQPAMDRDPN